MICLGIESTAHTFGCGIVDDSKVISNIILGYTTKTGGIHPTKAAEHHVKHCGDVVKQALEKANLTMSDIDVIAFSQGPGLGPCLQIGAMAARTLSILHKIPLIGVNHCIAHLEIGKFTTKAKDPVLLYVSGANTQIIAKEGNKYRIFGETLDMGVGNFLDNFARYLGLGFPGGPKIDKLAQKGNKYIELPYVVKGMDVSFGGILTNAKQKFNSKQYSLENLCYSIQETIFAMLLEVSERAMAHCQKTELLLGGGVACNKRLKEMAQKMCEQRNAKCFIPSNDLLVDNAAMIAHLGIIMYKAGNITKIKENIRPYERTDDIIVSW